MGHSPEKDPNNLRAGAALAADDGVALAPLVRNLLQPELPIQLPKWIGFA